MVKKEFNCKNLFVTIKRTKSQVFMKYKRKKTALNQISTIVLKFRFLWRKKKWNRKKKIFENNRQWLCLLQF